MRFFVTHDQLRDKFHHAPDLGSPIPETLANGELEHLANPSLYRERLETFRDKKILPDAYIKEYGKRFRLEMLDPDTTICEGTLSARREARGGAPKKADYNLYNKRTGFNGFFDEDGRQYRTGFITSEKQRNDIKDNGNIM